ncbi:hypothetical protein ScPMuIL_013563 [Solemya velum]
MYTRDEDSQSSGYSESKLYVADILSSMANSGIANSTTASIATYSVPAFISGVATGTTPTLTPTTLANIEQTFIELQSVPVSTANGQNPLTQSGFVPPIVAPGSGSDRYDCSGDSSSDSDYAPDIKRSRLGDTAPPSHSPGRKSRRGNERLSPEEEERRRVRRERNKLAAAKCRQRRVDHTNRLVTETEKLEDERASLETEIQELKQTKDQLEFILQAHQPLCKVEGASIMKVKTEPGTDSHSHCLSMRPNSLPLVKHQRKMRETVPTTSVDIPITTPSNGIFTFGLDSMVDGHTGLTPLTQISSSGVGVSCSSEVHRSSSESSTDAVASPTLISL